MKTLKEDIDKQDKLKQYTRQLETSRGSVLTASEPEESERGWAKGGDGNAMDHALPGRAKRRKKIKI